MKFKVFSTVFGLMLLFVGALFFAIPGCDLDVDTCLDSGGCWDYSAKKCRKEESNAQELCDRAIVSDPSQEQDFGVIKSKGKKKKIPMH